LKAIARAHRWVNQLQEGKALSIKEIAKVEGFNPRYVAHIMPLAYLAPDITESILGGNQPLTLNLDRLLKGFPGRLGCAAPATGLCCLATSGNHRRVKPANRGAFPLPDKAAWHPKNQKRTCEMRAGESGPFSL